MGDDRSNDGPKQIEAATATLYRASVSFGTNETQLIWTRYAGFLVVNGFFVHFFTGMLKDGQVDVAPLFVLLSALLGFVVNLIWYVLNQAGAINSLLWYKVADDLLKRCELGRMFGEVPTSFLAAKDRRDLWPYGQIYLLAQSLPALFCVVCASLMGWASSCLIGPRPKALAWVVGIIVTVLVLIVGAMVAGKLSQCAKRRMPDGPL
ncbi:MAG TPA: hypothetical protein PK668_25885 [Myxococcota bacterium]|nr:hypothetical protein [Myxococcota bacterium]HRY96959.1 hypothetical protein [Myxococcota bacterium]